MINRMTINLLKVLSSLMNLQLDFSQSVVRDIGEVPFYNTVCHSTPDPDCFFFSHVLLFSFYVTSEAVTDCGGRWPAETAHKII